MTPPPSPPKPAVPDRQLTDTEQARAERRHYGEDEDGAVRADVDVEPYPDSRLY